MTSKSNAELSFLEIKKIKQKLLGNLSETLCNKIQPKSNFIKLNQTLVNQQTHFSEN